MDPSCIYGFDWEDEDHVTRHGVSVEEIESVVLDDEGATQYVSHPDVAGRFFAFGKTAGGRWVRVIFDLNRHTDFASPRQAMDMVMTLIA